MGLASVPLPAQALIGLELVPLLVDVFVEADGLVVDDLGGQDVAALKQTQHAPCPNPRTPRAYSGAHFIFSLR